MKVKGRNLNLFKIYPKTHPILYKDSESREKKHQVYLNDFADPAPVLFEDSESWVGYE